MLIVTDCPSLWPRSASALTTASTEGAGTFGPGNRIPIFGSSAAFAAAVIANAQPRAYAGINRDFREPNFIEPVLYVVHHSKITAESNDRSLSGSGLARSGC